MWHGPGKIAQVLSKTLASGIMQSHHESLCSWACVAECCCSSLIAYL